jgi:hypothetical protein
MLDNSLGRSLSKKMFDVNKNYIMHLDREMHDALPIKRGRTDDIHGGAILGAYGISKDPETNEFPDDVAQMKVGISRPRINVSGVKTYAQGVKSAINEQKEELEGGSGFGAMSNKDLGEEQMKGATEKKGGGVKLKQIPVPDDLLKLVKKGGNEIEGGKKRKKRMTKKEKEALMGAGFLGDIFSSIGLGEKKNSDMNGGGLIGDVFSSIGLGKKKTGDKYRTRVTKKLVPSQQMLANVFGAGQPDARPVGGSHADVRPVGGAKKVNPWLEFVKKTMADKKLKNVKETIKYIKDNNLYKKK